MSEQNNNKRYEPKGSVLIVGGGIGGLTLGAALRKRGIGFTIVERTAELRAVGGGIAFTSNA